MDTHNRGSVTDSHTASPVPATPDNPTPFVDADRLTVAGEPIRVTTNIYADLKASLARGRQATLEAIRLDREERR